MKTAGKFTIKGTVHGIFFNNFCKECADSLSLRGYTRTLESGDVEVYAEGDKESLAKLEVMLKKGPAHARITQVLVEQRKWSGDFKDFSIIKF